MRPVLPTHTATGHAAADLGAQRILAYGATLGLDLDPTLCQELAEVILADYQAFFAGLRFARTQTSDTHS